MKKIVPLFKRRAKKPIQKTAIALTLSYFITTILTLIVAGIFSQGNPVAYMSGQAVKVAAMGVLKISLAMAFVGLLYTAIAAKKFRYEPDMAIVGMILPVFMMVLFSLTGVSEVVSESKMLFSMLALMYCLISTGILFLIEFRPYEARVKKKSKKVVEKIYEEDDGIIEDSED